MTDQAPIHGDKAGPHILCAGARRGKAFGFSVKSGSPLTAHQLLITESCYSEQREEPLYSKLTSINNGFGYRTILGSLGFYPHPIGAALILY